MFSVASDINVNHSRAVPRGFWLDVGKFPPRRSVAFATVTGTGPTTPDTSVRSLFHRLPVPRLDRWVRACFVGSCTACFGVWGSKVGFAPRSFQAARPRPTSN